MKKSLIILFFGLFFSSAVKAQIEKVIVETYYISDTLDATDTTDGRTLDAGSKTYRVYIDLKPGCKLVKMYGNAAHTLKISSTANFFNNIDRPTEYYGYLIKKNYFSSNPTLALDSWLTLGLATTVSNGVLKPQDPDGSTIGGTHNSGGSSGIAGGILRNNDPAAGIPLTTADGLSTNTFTYSSQFLDYGFKDATNIDTTAFGSVNTGSQFISNIAYLQQNSGISGAVPDSNQVLVAQLTTKGDISFLLNVTILDSSGHTIDYVAQNNGTPTGDTLLSPFLSYPPTCGCTDTKYLEYSPTYACSDPNACQTLKIFGCTDPLACNYDASANVLLPNFCCYPGYCNDRDIALVCPNLHARPINTDMPSEIYPNPVQDYLSLQLFASTDNRLVNYVIYDAFGKIVREKDMGMIAGNSIIEADVADLPAGLYLFRVSVAGISSVKKFIKN